jgi:7,8-dihydroneopterin aldolase/epimerase/oxygenase
MPGAGESIAATIRLHGVSVRTNHGVGAAEREVGQRMVFDVELVLADCRATADDSLDGTIDYGEVTSELVRVATGQSYLTLERLSTVIASTLLDRFGADRVTVRSTKPEPPVPEVMDGASVEVTLSAPVPR